VARIPKHNPATAPLDITFPDSILNLLLAQARPKIHLNI